MIIDRFPKIVEIDTKELKNTILAKLPRLETAVTHQGRLSLEEIGMILDLNPQQIVTEGNAKFQRPPREMIQVHRRKGKGKYSFRQ